MDIFSAQSSINEVIFLFPSLLQNEICGGLRNHVILIITHFGIISTHVRTTITNIISNAHAKSRIHTFFFMLKSRNKQRRIKWTRHFNYVPANYVQPSKNAKSSWQNFRISSRIIVIKPTFFLFPY